MRAPEEMPREVEALRKLRLQSLQRLRGREVDRVPEPACFFDTFRRKDLMEKAISTEPDNAGTGACGRRMDYWFLAAVFVITVGLYLSCLPKELTNWDDAEYVTHNPLIRSLSLQNLNAILTQPYFANYAPLTLISYALDFQLWGLNAAGYHFHSLALHLACVLAMYWVLRRFHLPRFVVLATVGLFAVHPVNVESVSWCSERKNLLAGLFFWLSFGQYLRYREESLRIAYLASILFFLLSLVSKASAIVAPLAFLAYDYYFKEKRILALRLLDKLPFLILAEIFSFASIYAAGTRSALRSYHGGGPLMSLFASGNLFQDYLEMMFWPTGLSTVYIPQIQPSLTSLAFWIPLLAFMGLAIFLFKRSKVLFFWLCFFVIFMLPVMNIVPLPIRTTNRYLYIPQAGAWIILASAAMWMYRLLGPFGLARRTACALACLWLFFVGYHTFLWNTAWRNSYTLWTDVVAKDFYNEMGHLNLGEWFVAHRQPNRAGLEYMIALGINRNYANGLAGMGNYYLGRGQQNRAIQLYYESLNLAPDSASTLNNLGSALLQIGRNQRALYFYFRALYLHPNNLKVMNNIALLYVGLRKADAAMEMASQMLQRFPGEPDGYLRAGESYELKEDWPKAIAAWEEARRRASGNSELVKQIDLSLSSVRARRL